MQAAPAYTAVAARQTLQRPPQPSSPKPQKVTWSPDVRKYVQRAFEQNNAIPGIDQKAMQEKLKVIITKAAESGQLETIDWSTYPLPQHMIKREREDAALYGTQAAILANINASAPPRTEASENPNRNPKKRKSPDTEPTVAEERATTPPYKKKNTKNGLEDRITGKSKKQKKIDAMRANAIENNADVLEKRSTLR